jgi:hypothetical protein
MRRTTCVSVLLAAAAAAWTLAGPAPGNARAASARDVVAAIYADGPALPLSGCTLECCCTLSDGTNVALRCADRADCEASGGTCESPSTCDE